MVENQSIEKENRVYYIWVTGTNDVRPNHKMPDTFTLYVRQTNAFKDVQ